jgi:hypothetical protein
MFKHIQKGSKVTWNRYWNKKIVGTVHAISSSYDLKTARVVFSDADDIHYHVNVEELVVTK